MWLYMPETGTIHAHYQEVSYISSMHHRTINTYVAFYIDLPIKSQKIPLWHLLISSANLQYTSFQAVSTVQCTTEDTIWTKRGKWIPFCIFSCLFSQVLGRISCCVCVTLTTPLVHLLLVRHPHFSPVLTFKMYLLMCFWFTPLKLSISFS